ncbi:MAG TPA: ABC transporter substrate-binding protein, partial [Cyanobacteria bacterium UBA11372]|nr:ABC transporter substrate-binding protein [Cyanobacteria bacterium UBA11372]
MKRWKQWRLVILTAICAFTLILSNCRNQPSTSPNASSPGATTQGVLVYGSGGQPVNLEPGNITDGNSTIVQDQIYDRLLEFKPGTTELAPSLATNWSVSQDGKTWTFKLRSGVKFHDGSEFNALAVKFNVERWWDEKHPNGYRDAGKTYQIWPQVFGGFKGEPNSLLQNIVVVDKSTIQFV